MMIVGSYAQTFTGDKTIADCNDIDVIATFEEVVSWLMLSKDNGTLVECGPLPNGKWIAKIKLSEELFKMVEFEIAESGSTGESLIKLNENKLIHVCPIMGNVEVASYTTQLLLKMSHRYLKNNKYFWKTVQSIKWLRDKTEHKPFTTEQCEWLKLREAETYSYAHPSLRRTKDQFFNGDEVNYVYDHDELHQVVKLMDQPAYTYFKADEQEVMCSKDKFNQLPFLTQICSVLEECWVLALERSQIPYHDKVTPEESFNMALQKVCTSISSGWWREFAWEHSEYILELGTLHKDSYYNKFKAAVESGQLKMKVT